MDSGYCSLGSHATLDYLYILLSHVNVALCIHGRGGLKREHGHWKPFIKSKTTCHICNKYASKKMIYADLPPRVATTNA